MGLSFMKCAKAGCENARIIGEGYCKDHLAAARETWESTHCPYCGLNMQDLASSKTSGISHLTGKCAPVDDWTNHQNHATPSHACHLCVEREHGPEVAKAMQRFWQRKKEVDAAAGQPESPESDNLRTQIDELMYELNRANIRIKELEAMNHDCGEDTCVDGDDNL